MAPLPLLFPSHTPADPTARETTEGIQESVEVGQQIQTGEPAATGEEKVQVETD